MESWIISTISEGASMDKCLELLTFYFENGLREKGKILENSYIWAESIDIIAKIARGERVTEIYLRNRLKRLEKNMWQNGHISPDPITRATELDINMTVPPNPPTSAPTPTKKRTVRGYNRQTERKWRELLPYQGQIKANCLTQTKALRQQSLWTN